MAERLSISQCPPELISNIFELACTDAGRTWPSLSAVSHTFHTLSAPYKFRSLTISTPRKAAAVAEAIHNTPTYLCRAVQLFLEYRRARVPWLDGSQAAHVDALELVETLCERIIWAVAPTLEYLVTEVDLAYLLPPGLVFPRLRELCVTTCTASMLEDTDGRRALPALRILQIQCFREPSERLGYSLGALSRIAPDLEVLRLGDALAYYEHLCTLRALLGVKLTSPRMDPDRWDAIPLGDLGPSIWAHLRGPAEEERVLHSLFPKLHRLHIESKRNRTMQYGPSPALPLLEALDDANMLVVHRPDSAAESWRFGGDLLRTLAWQDWMVRSNGGGCGCGIGISEGKDAPPCTKEIY